MKNKNPLLAVLAIILLAIFLYGLSWAVTVGIIKLITLCVGWGFSLAHATGIWLILCFAYLFWYQFRKERKKKRSRDLERCKNCMNSRPIVSEAGIHAACCLREGDAFECMIGVKDGFVERSSADDQTDAD